MVYQYKKPLRYKKKRSILRSRPFWLGITTLFLIGLGLYFFIFSKTFQVEKIIISGEKKTAEEEIKSIIEPRLENKILFLRTRSIFLINSKEMKKEVLITFPQIAEIEIRRDFPDALDVLVVERSGLVFWCQNDCFLLDNEGIIFEKTQFQEETGLVKIIGEDMIGSLNLGERVIEKEKLDKVLEIERFLKSDLKLPPKEISISAENRVNVKTLEGWEIYFDLNGDLAWQLSKLQILLGEKNFSQEREKLQYVDLRFEKVYYK